MNPHQLFDENARPSTLVEMLRLKALQEPERRIYTFLTDGEDESAHLTYGEVDRQARAISVLLRRSCGPGERALLLYPPGLEFIAAFFGCLYSGVIAIPAPPPDLARLKRTLPRLQAIVKDAQPALGLTTSAMLPTIHQAFAQAEELRALHWLTTDNADIECAAEWSGPEVTSETLAYLQYTSGSTSAPKGVMVKHGNVLHNSDYINAAWEYERDSVSIVWVPYFHDDGLVHGIIQPLYKSFRAYIMPPLSLIQMPGRWLKAISRYRGTHAGGPNFIYAMCARKVRPEDCTALDLSCWRMAYNAAEPIRKETLEKFAETFGAFGFRWNSFHPSYGLAESTLLVTTRRKASAPSLCTVDVASLEKENRVVEAHPDEPGQRTLVGCGQAVGQTKIVIANPVSLRSCLPDEVGEIWIADASVAQGYWNRPEETEQTFRARLADTGEGPFLRTGDLGFIRDGELYVAGRFKDLIIKGGANHYPQDIELTVEQSHLSIRLGSCAAFSVEVDEDERLVIVAEIESSKRQAEELKEGESRSHASLDQTVGAIRQAVAEQHELEVYAVLLLKAGAVPKTSSGKIQRHTCRAGFLEKSLDVVWEWRQRAEAKRSKASSLLEDDDVGALAVNKPAEAIQDWLVSRLMELLKIERQAIGMEKSFESYGMGSIDAVSLTGELGRWLGRRLSPTLIWEHPNIRALARHLAGESAATLATFGGEERLEVTGEPIAVIGIGCRFPQANGPEAFWQLLRNGMDAITEVPAERWDINAFYDANPAAPGKVSTRWGGFLEHVDQFDPQFFGISPREAARMDPQQRLLLEVAWEALEDAGQAPEHLAGKRSGVFIGISTNDYSQIQLQDPALIDAYLCTGNSFSIAANRLSYFFDFRGPSVVVDTACSSSLVAVHFACISLWAGETTLALAGGANLILSPANTINFTKAGAMASDGRCKAFDARADGYVRSEGAGVVVLKPLSYALADGDPVYAVIRGSAVNNDGRTNGLMAPSRQAQEAVMREAYWRAGISPGAVHYVEAHGTGTFLGDPIEAMSLGTVLAEDRPPKRPCAVGSVKTNIGHLEAAAGIAGLIKVALSLKHKELPPSLHFEEPNPHISFEELPIRVQRSLTAWPVDSTPARAGVSSFGFGGTNAHVVLEEAPASVEARQEKTTAATQRTLLLPLSAHSPEALAALAQSYLDFTADEAARPDASLYDICYTASVRRSHHENRLAVVCDSRSELTASLEAFLRGETHPGLCAGRKAAGRQRKIVFVFPGQGSQWIGMGRELLRHEPVFREAIEQCAHAVQNYVDWSLIEQLAADEAGTQSESINVIQPMLFAIQVALAALWRAWGIEPDALVGQSMGEVAAAHVAGALSLDEAARVICRRSALLKSRSGQGSMAAVELSLEQAGQYLLGYEDRVSIAVSNSPISTVLSGDSSALDEIIKKLEEREIFCRPLKVDVASHSPQMEPLRDELFQALDGLESQPARLPLYSTVTGMPGHGLCFDATYWWRNLREPVLFSKAIQQLVENGHDTFIEISPHPIVLNSIQQGLHHIGAQGVVLPSLRREERERATMLASLGTLYGLEHQVHWRKLYPEEGRCVQLPTYPWQRERCWLDVEKARDGAKGNAWRRRCSANHPLLDRYFHSVHPSEHHFWEIELQTQTLSYLSEHRVQESVLFPATAFLETALAAACEAFSKESLALTGVEFRRSLHLTEEATRTLQVVVTPSNNDEAAFHIYSREDSREEGNAPDRESWTLHARGRINYACESIEPSLLARPTLEEIRSHLTEEISGDEHYLSLREWGFQYGDSFQGIERLWRGEGEALGQLRTPAKIKAEMEAYNFHPALLDACLQVLTATLRAEAPDEATARLYLPVRVEHFRIFSRPGPQSWSHARLRIDAVQNPGLRVGDVRVIDESGLVVAEATGVHLQEVERNAPHGKADPLDGWFYELKWQTKALASFEESTASRTPEQHSSWIIFTDGGETGQELAALLGKRGDACLFVAPGQGFAQTAPNYYHVNPSRRDEFTKLFEHVLESDQPPWRGIVHLWSLFEQTPGEITLDSLKESQLLGCGSALHLLQALAEAPVAHAPRLWLTTRGAQNVEPQTEPIAIAQAPLWGLGRTIAQEHPELKCTNVDLGAKFSAAEIRALAREILADDSESQIAFREESRYVARLVRRPAVEAMPTAQEASSEETGRKPSPDERRCVVPKGQTFRVETAGQGSLENLRLRAVQRQRPAAGEVEIEVHTGALNFVDVLRALGIVPGQADVPAWFGGECAGRIVTVGEGVDAFQVGDEVVAIAQGCFSPYVVTRACLATPKPSHLSFEEAATIPVAFVTALYALQHLGRLGAGERVLVHAASGGVGLAAIQLAQRAGAEIYATAGSAEKREFLHSLGVHHVMDSRSLAFAGEVLARTVGEGVDVVLNSLAGEAIPKSISTLAAYGRFIEIGKRDIYENAQLELGPFQKNLSFFAVDVDRMVRERPEFVGTLLREVMALFDECLLRTLPLQTFPVSHVVSAFRHMAQARHIGKIVIALQDKEAQLTSPAEMNVPIRADGTYLITGGLGGLGLLVARWMAERGARHLTLVGRSGATPEAEKALEEIRACGAEVVALNADVARLQEVADLIAGVNASMPLRGIVHAAGVLDDGILLQLDLERLRSVMAPKVEGAWNLHTQTQNMSLDFFVLFSSAASLIGPPGQGNYAAANAFLDALAYRRRAQGQPALSINWAPWSEKGLAARSDRGGRLALRGIGSIPPPEGLRALAELIGGDSAQVVVMPIDWRRWSRHYPEAARTSLFVDLVREADSAGASSSAERETKKATRRESILAVAPEQRQFLTETYLREQVARVLGLSLPMTDARNPLNKLGLDSIMAVELKYRIEIDLGAVVSVVKFLKGSSIADIAVLVLEQFAEQSVKPAAAITTWPTISEAAKGAGDGKSIEQLLAELDEYSEDEVDSLLGALLSPEEAGV